MKTVFCIHIFHVNTLKCFWKYLFWRLLLKILILQKATCKQNRSWLFTNSGQVFPGSLLRGSARVGMYHTNDISAQKFFTNTKNLLNDLWSHYWKTVYLIHVDLASWRLGRLRRSHTFDTKCLLPSYLVAKSRIIMI